MSSASPRRRRRPGLPIILSTVNVSTGANQPTVSRLTDALPGVEAIDRTTMNFVGRHRFPARRGGHRAHETRDGGALDRGVLDASLVGRDASRLRDVPDHRRRRRHLQQAAHRAGLARLLQAGAACPSAGCSSPASCSVTGTGRQQSRRSRRSSSPTTQDRCRRPAHP